MIIFFPFYFTSLISNISKFIEYARACNRTSAKLCAIASQVWLINNLSLSGISSLAFRILRTVLTRRAYLPFSLSLSLSLSPLSLSLSFHVSFGLLYPQSSAVFRAGKLNSLQSHCRKRSSLLFRVANKREARRPVKHDRILSTTVHDYGERTWIMECIIYRFCSERLAPRCAEGSNSGRSGRDRKGGTSMCCDYDYTLCTL